MSSRQVGPPGGAAGAPSLPSWTLLGGTDNLLLAVDVRMRRRDGVGLVCHLAIEVDGDADALAAEVEAAQARPDWAWLRSLRLRGRPPWARYRWEACGPTPPEVDRFEVAEGDALPEALPAVIDPAVEPVVRLAVGRVGDRAAVVLTWHHAALDARGAEAWLAALMGGPGLEMPALPQAPSVGGPMAALWEAKRGRDFLLWESVGRVRHLPAGRGRGLRLRRTVAGAELAAVEATVGALGAGPFRSLAHLAVAGRAFAGALPAASGDLLVPVPQDPRRGDEVAAVGNAIRMLILRVPGAALSDGRATVAALTERLRAAVRDRLPAAVERLLEACRWLPGRVLLGVALLPTWGRMASFGFSDTGDRLSRFEVAWGRPVRYARHYPAGLHPPGCTVVFSRFRDELAVDLLWQAGRMDEAAAGALLDRLLDGLRGAGGPR